VLDQRIGTRFAASCASRSWSAVLVPNRQKQQISFAERNVEAIARMEHALEAQRTFGERVADGFAAAVGSWPFIIVQSVLLAAWVVLNVCWLLYRWDPYPFILLNLVLSFQAAYASPIIMMSQNRQSKIADRRNQLDLQVNLLAEQESTETLRLLRKLCEHVGVEMKTEGHSRGLEVDTHPEEVVNLLEKAIQQPPKL
jgi:uncharacterized membrane protein